MYEGSINQSANMDTRAVYDRDTGVIVHIHHAIAIPGVELPSDEQLNAAAIDLASKLTNRPAAQVDVLRVAEELKPGHTYAVDVKGRCLIQRRSERSAASE